MKIKTKKSKKQVELVENDSKAGIIYLSKVPTYMNVKKVRHIFQQFGDVGRIYLQPDGEHHDHVFHVLQ